MRAANFVAFSAISYFTLAAAAGEPQRHTFIAGNHIITIEVRFGKPTQVRAWSSTATQIRSNRSVSPAMAKTELAQVASLVPSLATFTVKPTGRPPFDKMQVVTNGTITDLEAFGYDESGIAEGEREVEREKSRKQLWRLCRQELYLNDETVRFAVIHWRYTLDAVEIVRVQSGLLIGPPDED
jgi:hypothetical protein